MFRELTQIEAAWVERARRTVMFALQQRFAVPSGTAFRAADEASTRVRGFLKRGGPTPYSTSVLHLTAAWAFESLERLGNGDGVPASIAYPSLATPTLG